MRCVVRRVIAFAGIVGIGLGCVRCGEDDDFDSAAEDGSDGGGLIDAGESLSGLQVINPSCGAGTGGELDECDDCVMAQCAAQFEQCFGAAWQTELGGTCSAFGACIQACDCGDSDCFGVCSSELESNPTDPCLSCVRTLLQCEVAECESICLDADEPDAGRDGGGMNPGDAGSDGGG